MNEHLFAISQLSARYAQVLDNGDISTWPDFFTANAVYTVQSRENFDAKLPLCLLRFESQAMLRDRAYAATQTIYHDPYSQRHLLSPPLILESEAESATTETNFLVMRTRRDSLPTVLCVGRYLDRLQRVNGAWLFAERRCIYDNDLIDNSIILPI
jgi:salicylate 5-hydroxylase small subunit